MIIRNFKINRNELFDKDKLPQHLAIIMDGNGRWAERRGLPRSAGHREGAKAVRRVITNCLDFKNNIKINFIGRLDNLPNSLTEKMKELHESTKRNNKLILNIAINYSGRTEIVDALKSILLKIDNKKLSIEEINENIIRDNLYTHNLPDPDLLIRTAGEMRISNFMLWQIAYTELWVTPVFWPDFDENNLVEAIRNFQKRVRKYGGKV